MYKGWIDVDMVAACFEGIESTAEDITGAMRSERCDADTMPPV